jgi:hypothetical protein
MPDKEKRPEMAPMKPEPAAAAEKTEQRRPVEEATKAPAAPAPKKQETYGAP